MYDQASWWLKSFLQVCNLTILDDRRPVAEIWSWKGRVDLKHKMQFCMIVQIAQWFWYHV